MNFRIMTLPKIVMGLTPFLLSRRGRHYNQKTFIVSLFSVIASLTSCDQIVSKKLKLEDLKTERMQEVTWDVIDRFPGPPQCDLDEDSAQLDSCLGVYMKRLLSNDQTLLRALKAHFGDRVKISLSVNANGRAHFTLRSKDSTVNPKESVLISKLNQSIGSDPWNPAIKRGLPVNTSFPYDIVLTD